MLGEKKGEGGGGVWHERGGALSCPPLREIGLQGVVQFSSFATVPYIPVSHPAATISESGGSS